MSEVMIHIRSLVCAGINKKANVKEDSKLNLCTLARSLLTPTEAITFLTDYNIPDVLIPESLNDAFTQEAKMQPEAISGSSPKSAPGSTPEIQPIWRIKPSPDNRTFSLKVRASVEEIGQAAFDELQYAETLQMRQNEQSLVEQTLPKLESTDKDHTVRFIAEALEYWARGGLKAFTFMIVKKGNKAWASKLGGRPLNEYDERELWHLISTWHTGGTDANPFPFRRELRAARMTNPNWSRKPLETYLGDELQLEHDFPDEFKAIKLETQLELLWDGLACPTFKALMADYKDICTSTQDFRAECYKRADAMDSHISIEKIKSKGMTKPPANLVAPSKQPPQDLKSLAVDATKDRISSEAFSKLTKEERAEHFRKRTEKQISEGIALGVAAALAKETSKKSFAAVAAASPAPEPCINCNKSAHHPWSCKEYCELTICKAMKLGTHRADRCIYYAQMREDFEDSKSIRKKSAHAAIYSPSAVIDDDDGDMYDPWGYFHD